MATSTDAPTEQLEACSIRKNTFFSVKNFILLNFLEGPSFYTSEKNGNDETGDGSESKPFKTAFQVFLKTREKKVFI